MRNSMVMLTSFVFGRKYPVWDNVVQKIKIVSLRWNLIPRLIRICWIQWCCSLFSFLTGNALLGQIWSKLSIFTVFFVSDQKCPFLGKFGPKCQNCQFKAKFVSYSNSNMQNWKAVFTFFVFDWKRPPWTNLVQIFNIYCLRWNLIPRLIRLYRIQCQCSFFYRSETLFFGKFGPKCQNCECKAKLGS